MGLSALITPTNSIMLQHLIFHCELAMKECLILLCF